jgi:3-oxoacyl-[acyl-carrier-protein] synthase-1
MSFFIRAAALDDLSGLRQRAGLSEAEWTALPCIAGSSSHGIGRVEDDPQPRLAPPIEFARELTRSFGVTGPVLLTSSACTSGLTALQLTLDLLEAGAFPHALVLGIERPNRLSAAGFRSLGLEMRLGSALGALVVSRERGSWKIASLAWAMDPSNLTAVKAGAMAEAMRKALARAGWRASEVELIKLQAAGDAEEQAALASLFSPLPKTLSLRSELGHTLGASGPVELTWIVQRPETRILFNLSGFGGQAASMALERA